MMQQRITCRHGNHNNPLGPLLFCLTIHDMVQQIHCELTVFYLDDRRHTGWQPRGGASLQLPDCRTNGGDLGLKLMQPWEEGIFRRVRPWYLHLHDAFCQLQQVFIAYSQFEPAWTTMSHQMTVISTQYEACSLDFTGLQETTLTTALAEKLPGRYVLWCFPSPLVTTESDSLFLPA